MDKNKLIAELLGTGCYIAYSSDAGKVAILRAIKRTGDLEDFLLDDDELKAQTGLEIDLDDSPGLNLKRR